jgi:ribose 5-phosphate isomerase B
MVRDGSADRGILVCGTGIGMSMAANRHKGIRAALCHEIFTAAMSRHHNDANVLYIKKHIIGSALAREMVKTWIETPFDEGRHSRRISMFD